MWGSLYGAGTGALIGGAGSVMTGGDIKEGIIFGAATGLVGGGFQGYCSAKSQGLNPWTGAKLPETTVNTPNVMLETPKEMAPKEPGTTGEYGVSFNDKIQHKVPCPDGWKVVESNKKGGIKYIDPANPKGNNIRIMPGNPNSPNPVQKEPYVKWFINGKFYDVHGNCLGNNNTILESHIPLDEFNLNVMPRK